MSTSRSGSYSVPPSLEILEARDVPSIAGDALSYAGPLYLSQANASARSWTSALQIDFSTLQHNIQTQGWTSATVGSLAKVMSAYGFAEQTYNFAGRIDNLLETGLLLGAAEGAFGMEDAENWLSTWIQLHNLDSLINQDTGIANDIAHSPISTPNGPTTILELSS
jgi:hypothetical protein